LAIASVLLNAATVFDYCAARCRCGVNLTDNAFFGGVRLAPPTPSLR